MKRTKLLRRTPLKPSQKPLKRSPLSRVSAKGKARGMAYSVARRAYLFAHPVCEAGRCHATATELHHRRGRNGTLLTDARFFMSLCPAHHAWIHRNPAKARAKGWLAP